MTYDSVTKIFLIDPGIPEKVLKTEKNTNVIIFRKDVWNHLASFRVVRVTWSYGKYVKKEIGIKLMEIQRMKYQPVIINAKNIFYKFECHLRWDYEFCRDK